MSWIAIRNFEIEKTDRGFTVFRYETTTQEFEWFGERDDLEEAVNLMIDGWKAEISEELEKFVFISPTVCKCEGDCFAEQRRKARAKLTFSLRETE